MKYLLLIGLVVFGLWLLRRSSARRHRNTPATRPPEKMVVCDWCGVNHPFGESVVSEGRHYCCVEHRQQADDAGR